MNNTNYFEIYTSAKKQTNSQKKATSAVIAAGMSFADACDLCWKIETGKASPHQYGIYADTRSHHAAEEAELNKSL